MRVIVLVKANEHTEAGVIPSERLLEEMGTFNEELVDSGIIVAMDGLHPSSKGARVSFRGDKVTVTDGPFPETKELVAGFWIWEVDSMKHAIELAKRIPNPPDERVSVEESIVEIRPIFEYEDFLQTMEARNT